MGQIANIIDLRAYQRAKAPSTVLPHGRATSTRTTMSSEFARVMPGVAEGASEHLNAPITEAESRRRSHLSRIVAELGPKFLTRFQSATLIAAVGDATAISAVSLFENHALWRHGPSVFHLGFLPAYIIFFVIFAAEENWYLQRAESRLFETGAALRTVAWATLLSSFCLSWTASRTLIVRVLCFSAGNVCALLARRWLWHSIDRSQDGMRNVLIVGSGTDAQQLAETIHSNEGSGRLVKGFVAEHHLRNVYGPTMLGRIAREEFIDEIVIASADPIVINAAIREGRSNALDVTIAPQVPRLFPGAAVALQNIGGIALLQIHKHPSPEVALAVKRILDVGLALCGLIALSPVFVMIGVVVKLDSFGPALYRGTRIGRKGQKFLCYKFRTMVHDADGSKNELRSRNERKGAFFKIENDPRVTRVGRFLRRYSLDELPQLWNVLLGQMSLVGPRPHPPDDVSHYKVQDLQRLDFVPGITGLWQVTARRDTSFERSVALDVEYIKGWNLWLDVRILWRTVFAVLEGSGA